MRALPVPLLLLSLTIPTPATAAGAAGARPATMPALSFLLGSWDVEMTTFPATYGEAAGSAYGATECSLQGEELHCRTTADLPDGRPYWVEVVVTATDGVYRARVRNPGGEATYGGRWRRPDTLVFVTDPGRKPQRVLYRDAGPGRIWFYVEELGPEGTWLPHSEATWTVAEEAWSPPGRRDTGRHLTVDAIVPGAPDAVAALFLDPGALNRFMGDAARVGAGEGDPYEVAFLPASHPDSGANSTAGAVILAHEPGRRLVVEWTAPPWLGGLNRDPLPTWAEISFRAWEADAPATHVRVVHRGFGEGAEWDRLRSFLRAGWGSILFRLQGMLWGR